MSPATNIRSKPPEFGEDDGIDDVVLAEADERGRAEAERIGQPMCISVVDNDSNLLAFARTHGSKALSFMSSRNEAVTAPLSPIRRAAEFRCRNYR